MPNKNKQPQALLTIFLVSIGFIERLLVISANYWPSESLSSKRSYFQGSLMIQKKEQQTKRFELMGYISDFMPREKFLKILTKHYSKEVVQYIKMPQELYKLGE